MSSSSTMNADRSTNKRAPEVQSSSALSLKKDKKKIKIELKPATALEDVVRNKEHTLASNSQLLLQRKPSIFEDNDSDTDADEMPPECRMRMRNLGRDTPTSSGPNSFSKGKHGFIDARKLAERKLLMMTQEPDD